MLGNGANRTASAQAAHHHAASPPPRQSRHAQACRGAAVSCAWLVFGEVTSTALHAPNAADEASQNSAEDSSCSTLEPLEASRRSGPLISSNGVQHVLPRLQPGPRAAPSPSCERVSTRPAHLPWPRCCRATGHHHARHCFRPRPWPSAHARERDLFKPLLPVRPHHALAVCPLAGRQLANGCPLQSAAMERQRPTRRAVRASDAHVYQPGARAGPVGA